MVPAQPNRSIMTGITVLQEVVTAGAPVGSRDLARRMHLEHSRVNRILGTLVHMGMLGRGHDRKYVAGPGVHVLSAQSLHASGLIPASLGPLRELQRLGATVALGTLWRDVVCYLLHARPDVDLASTVGAHETFPADESVIAAAIRSEERFVRLDRAERDEVSWGAAVGEPPVAAIAAVFPAGHPLGEAESTGELIRRAARTIGQASTPGEPNRSEMLPTTEDHHAGS